MVLGGLQLSCPPRLANLRSHWKRRTPHRPSYFITWQEEEESPRPQPPATAQPVRDCLNPAQEKPQNVGPPVNSSGHFA